MPGLALPALPTHPRRRNSTGGESIRREKKQQKERKKSEAERKRDREKHPRHYGVQRARYGPRLNPKRGENRRSPNESHVPLWRRSFFDFLPSPAVWAELALQVVFSPSAPQ